MDGLMSLISAQEFQGFKIKEWNIIQFSKLSGVLASIAREYRDKNVSFEQFTEALSGASMVNLSTAALDIMEPFLKHAALILQVSVGADQKRLEEVSYTDGLIVLILVLKANLEHMTGFFTKLAGEREAVPATDSNPS